MTYRVIFDKLVADLNNSRQIRVDLRRTLKNQLLESLEGALPELFVVLFCSLENPRDNVIQQGRDLIGTMTGDGTHKLNSGPLIVDARRGNEIGQDVLVQEVGEKRRLRDRDELGYSDDGPLADDRPCVGEEWREDLQWWRGEVCIGNMVWEPTDQDG